MNFVIFLTCFVYCIPRYMSCFAASSSHSASSYNYFSSMFNTIISMESEKPTDHGPMHCITWSNSHALEPNNFHQDRGKQFCQWAKLSVRTNFFREIAGHSSLKDFCGRWASSVKQCSGDWRTLSPELHSRSSWQVWSAGWVSRPGRDAYSLPSSGVIFSL